MADFYIIGGGPVGFCVSLLLAKQGIRSVIFESRSSIPNDPEQSYPIGVNPRGIHALEQIDLDCAQKIKDSGMIVDSWQIFGGERRVAKQDSVRYFV